MHRLRGIMGISKERLLEGDVSPKATTDLTGFTALSDDQPNKKTSAAAAYQKKANAATKEAKPDPLKKEQALLKIGLPNKSKSIPEFIKEQNGFMLEAALNGASLQEIRTAGKRLDDDEMVKSAILNIAAKIEYKQLDQFREQLRNEQNALKLSTLKSLPAKACATDMVSPKNRFYPSSTEIDFLTGPPTQPKEVDLLTPSDPLKNLFEGMSINNGPAR